MSSLEESFIILGSSPNSMDPSMSIINDFENCSLTNGNAESYQTTTTSTAVNTDQQVQPATSDFQAASPLSSFKSVMNRSAGETIASNFLMGKIDQEQLKSSVFQQFPSINTSQTKFGDVLKLYSLLDEHAQLKGKQKIIILRKKKVRSDAMKVIDLVDCCQCRLVGDSWLLWNALNFIFLVRGDSYLLTLINQIKISQIILLWIKKGFGCLESRTFRIK